MGDSESADQVANTTCQMCPLVSSPSKEFGLGHNRDLS